MLAFKRFAAVSRQAFLPSGRSGWGLQGPCAIAAHALTIANAQTSGKPFISITSDLIYCGIPYMAEPPPFFARFQRGSDQTARTPPAASTDAHKLPAEAAICSSAQTSTGNSARPPPGL